MSFAVIERRHSSTHPWTYVMLDQFQRTVKNTLIFSELAPIITLGRRSKLLSDSDAIIPRISVDRGGNETWHGPGQIVIFPVLEMEPTFGSKFAVKKATHALLEISLEAVNPFIPGARIESGDRQGIWSDRGKIVSIGISLQKGMLYHGVAINLYPTEWSFHGINPCAIDGAKPDFCYQAASETAFTELKQLWEKSFRARFALQESRLERDGAFSGESHDPHQTVQSSASFLYGGQPLL